MPKQKTNKHLHEAKKKKNDEWFEIPGHPNYLIREDGEVFFQGVPRNKEIQGATDDKEVYKPNGILHSSP